MASSVRNFPSPIDIFLAVAPFLLILIVFYPVLAEIARICWNDDDYSHGLLLPIVAAYMYWENRKFISKGLRDAQERAYLEGKKTREYSKVLAFLVLIAGLFLLFVGQVSGISYTGWIAFFPVVVATIFLVFGRTAAWMLSPPILLLFLAKPLPDSLVVRLFWPLQVFAAKASKVTLELFNVPVYLAGNIIEIPGMRLLVEEACSGMRSAMAILTLAVIVIYFIKLSHISKILLVGIALLVAIVLNISRVALTGLLAHFYDPETATGFFHTFSGLIVFIVGLPILYIAGRLLVKLDSRFAKSSR